MTDVKRMSLVKPTLNTRYHIDFHWWQDNDRDWRVFLRDYLCKEHQKAFESIDLNEMVDWIDPQTAEVHQVDGLQHVLITHCARQQEFLEGHSTLVDSVFRLFLSNGNMPLNANEMAEQLGRDAYTLLRTLSGGRTYRGLRPTLD